VSEKLDRALTILCFILIWHYLRKYAEVGPISESVFNLGKKEIAEMLNLR
jgi:hypothetical protein